MEPLHNHSLFDLKNEKLFENRRILMRAHEAAQELQIPVSTVYNWKYRGHLHGVPEGLFLKLNRMLYVRVDILRQWIQRRS